MKILLLGSDGYLGYATYHHFKKLGHDVLGVDNLSKRQREIDCGVRPLNERPPLVDRNLSVEHFEFTKLIEEFEPDVVIHYAEQPSAPYSMMGRMNAIETQKTNVLGTLNLIHSINPDTHIVKLGTMGEYGTPNIPIEEGWITIRKGFRKDRLLFPKKAGSWYHLSKVHDSNNLEFACRNDGLRVTDLNQGVVYGWQPRFHYDAIFGTVINRFIAQAVAGIPLTVYGRGGQTRAYLNIEDTLQCVQLAVENPAERGEFRVFNQFTEVFSINELAEMVARVTGATIEKIKNPRKELEEHYYKTKNTNLIRLGLKPKYLTDDVVASMVENVKRHKKDINATTIKPTITW